MHNPRLARADHLTIEGGQSVKPPRLDQASMIKASDCAEVKLRRIDKLISRRESLDAVSLSWTPNFKAPIP